MDPCNVNGYLYFTLYRFEQNKKPLSLRILSLKTFFTVFVRLGIYTKIHFFMGFFPPELKIFFYCYVRKYVIFLVLVLYIYV